jgi:hypothetical protein
MEQSSLEGQVREKSEVGKLVLNSTRHQNSLWSLTGHIHNPHVPHLELLTQK